MFKKIALFLFLMMLVVGTVHASSINGDYKGNPIVKVTSNGKQLETDEVPAMIYDGHTVVPISLLRQLGASVIWDGNTYSVDVNLPSTPNTDIVALAKKYKKYNVGYVQLASDGSDFLHLTLIASVPLSTIFSDNESFKVFLNDSVTTQATYFSIEGIDGNSFSVLVDNVRDFFAGKITSEQLSQSYRINGLRMDQAGTTQNKPSEAPETKEVPSLYSNDGKTFLGKLSSNKFDNDSIFNEFGTYGNKFAAISIWNEFGTYGGEFSNTSPFNQFATKPPTIVQDGKVIGYLTINTTIKGAISPIGLLEWLKKQGY